MLFLILDKRPNDMPADADSADMIIKTANNIAKIAKDFLERVDNVFCSSFSSLQHWDQAGCLAPEL